MRRLHPNAHVEVPDPDHPGSILEVCVSDLTVFDLIECRWKPIGKVDSLINELFEVREHLAKARSRNEELEEQVAALKELVDELSEEEEPPLTRQQVRDAYIDHHMTRPEEHK